MIEESEVLKGNLGLKDLKREANELVSIFVAATKTVKAGLNQN